MKLKSEITHAFKRGQEVGESDFFNLCISGLSNFEFPVISSSTHTHTHTGRERETETETETDRQTDRQTDRKWGDRKVDRIKKCVHIVYHLSVRCLQKELTPKVRKRFVL